MPSNLERWILPTVLILGLTLPILGTWLLNGSFSDWSRLSLSFHSTLEVAGAALGLLLAIVILFTKQTALTSRRMWIACALVSMAGLDIFHSSVPAEVAFVWLHSLAVLAGGVFFALVWFPEREISRETAWATAGTVLLVTVLIGSLSILFSHNLPPMIVEGEFTPVAQAINLLGGGLTILAALNFGIGYTKNKSQDEFLFLLVCLLFGMSGVIFYMSSVWEAGWWFWHVLRFAAYLFAFWLALLSYRSSENKMLQAHSELDGFFHTAVDGKRLIDLDFNQLRLNDTFVALSGMSRELAQKLKCYETFHSPLCHTDECPVTQIKTGIKDSIQKDILKTRKDGKQVFCSLNATRLNAADGSLLGIVESFWDITDRKQAEEAIIRQARLLNAINMGLREALTCETEEDVAKTALRVAEDVTGSKFGWIGEINSAGLMDTIAINNPGWEACDIVVSDAKNFIKNMPLRGIDRTTLKEGKSRIVNADQIATHPDRVGIPRGHPPITAFLGVPFKQGDKTVGMIGLASKEGGYSREDQEVIEVFSAAFYQALIRKRMERQVREQVELKTNQAQLATLMRGDLPEDTLCQNIISFLCKRLKAQTGLMYLVSQNGTFKLTASYAHKHKKHQASEYKPGEGLVGQAALERNEIILANVPKDYFTIESGLGETLPRNIFVKPIVHNGKVKAVIELGTLENFTDSQAQFLNMVMESIAMSIESAESRTQLATSLEESQRLTEELQAQQEELKSANEELEEQTQRLQSSQEKLKAQQDELQATNEELEEKNRLLERQKQDVEQARREIAKKVEALALVSKYKSEFLANMSHELRTPLNSLLLLARSLSENKAGNLTADEVESADVIYQSGNDLLSLINDILDLSKVESGHIDLQLDQIRLSDLTKSLRTTFRHLAKDKGLSLSVSVEDSAPEHITSDRKRVEQVLKNLVSNSIKFTQKGSVKVIFKAAAPNTDLRQSGLDPKRSLAIAVEDTGIGIAPEHQRAIFEAFQQADAGTSRKYAGTGLGLSIARELVRILGGEIHLSSQPGKGSTFTAFLSVDEPKTDLAPHPLPAMKAESDRSDGCTPVQVASILDDRERIKKGDRSILLIEDDPKFAEVLAKQCHQQDLKVLAAATGQDGIDLAKRFVPQGIVLDLKLPGMDGWQVLDLLKEDPETRHIPVHIASVDEPSVRAMRKGAVGHVQKPLTYEQIDAALKKLEETASRKAKKVLVVEDNENIRKGMVELIADEDVIVDEAAGGGQAIQALRSSRYDCMILDLGLWDFDGEELLKRIEKDKDIQAPPVIVHTARDLTWEQDLDLRAYSDSIIIKDARSDERLLDEVTLFLHRVVAEMPEKKRQVITNLYDSDALLRDKKILLVDDDMRTLFALSKMLADRGMRILKADNGKRALELLEQKSDVDIVLLDIMMPVLDGYETLKQIRSQDRFKKLPIIALTAKAMKGDQERCFQAGASDYLPKPVDQDRLVSMLRVWLYR